MRYRIYSSAGLLLIVLLFTAAAAKPAPRLIIISWDATAAWIVDKLLEEGKLPNLARLARKGFRAKNVTPAFPSKTAPGHAAIWTGTYSDVNGVSGNMVPILPRSDHTLLEQTDGFDSAALKAEPIWLTALLAGKRVTALSATHITPATPYLAAMKAAGIPAEHFLSFDKFRADISPPNVWTAETLTAAAGWAGLRAEKQRAKESALKLGDNAFYVLAYDAPDDPTDGYDTVAVCPQRKQVTSECAILKPASAVSSTNQWSKPYRVTKADLFGFTYFRLFSLSTDGSRMTLYQRGSAGFRSTASKELTEEYMLAAGGSGDTGFAAYRQGLLGTPISQSGNGTAERRLIEIVRFDLEIRERAVKFAMQRLNPDLIFHYSSAGDDAGHAWMGVLDPESPAYDAATAAKLWPFYAEVFHLQDDWLGKVIDSARTNAIISLVSDHGMMGAGRTFYPNAVLEPAGLMSRTADRKTINLARTRICAPPWGDFFLSVNSTDWKGGIVPPAEREDVIRRATEALLAATDPDTGKRIVTRIFRREEDSGLGIGGPAGGDLYLDLAAGYTASSALSDDVVRKVASPIGIGVHGFYPQRSKMQAVWFVAGPGVAAGKEIGGMRLIDIAPTLNYLMGIPSPRNVQGHVIAEALAAH